MREFRTSGSVGAPASNRWGDPTSPNFEEGECLPNRLLYKNVMQIVRTA